jgi:hypothetical protein
MYNLLNFIFNGINMTRLNRKCFRRNVGSGLRRMEDRIYIKEFYLQPVL